MSLSRLLASSRLWWLGAMGLGFALHFISLTRYPPPHCDEPYYSSFALNIIRRGEFGSPVMGPVYGIDQNHLAYGRLFGFGLGILLNTLGVSLVAARLFPLMGWIAMAAAVFWVGRRIYGANVGLWGMVLAALSWKTFFAAHQTRPEIWLAAAAILPLGWMTGTKTSNNLWRDRWAACLAGIVAALILDIHFNGAFFLAGISLAALYRWLWRARRWDLLLTFGCGVAAGLMWWAATRFLPDPVLGWYQWRVGFSRTGMGIGSTTVSASLINFAGWLVGNFWSGNRGLDAVESALYLVGIAAALRRRGDADAPLLLFAGASLLLFAFMMPQKLLTYRVLWVPPLSILAAEGARQLAVVVSLRWPALRPQWSMPAVLASACALWLAGWAWLGWLYRGGDFAGEAQRLRALIPPGTTVLGDPIWWFDFQADHDYTADIYILWYASEVTPPLDTATPVSQRLTEDQVVVGLRRIGTEYVILDDYLHCLSTTEYQPDTAFRRWVKNNCLWVGQAQGGWAGSGFAPTSPLGETSAVYYCGGALD